MDTQMNIISFNCLYDALDSIFSSFIRMTIFYETIETIKYIKVYITKLTHTVKSNRELLSKYINDLSDASIIHKIDIDDIRTYSLHALSILDFITDDANNYDLLNRLQVRTYIILSELRKY